jgi:hypothetical protein
MSYSGGAITRGAEARLLQLGVRKVYAQEYTAYEKQYVKIFETKKSSKAYEVDVQFGGFGLAPVKPEGSGIQYDTQQEGFQPTYTPLTYAKGFIVTMEAFDDQLYDLFPKKARGLAFSMAQTKEVAGANVLNRAFDNAYVMQGGDGVSLINTSHVLGPITSGTFSNTLQTQAALSETAIEDLCINISQAVDSRGLRIALKPTQLIVPAKLGFEATRILKSVLQNDTANNAVNALMSTGVIANGHTVNNFLTSDTAWFIKTNAPDGMILTERQDAIFSEDNDFDTSNFRFKAIMRFNFGWTDPRGLYGSGNI